MMREQTEKVRSGRGFFAALDQSGGSTPQALAEYGVAEDAYATDEEMFDLVHQMRTRVVTSPAVDGSRVLAAIRQADLFATIVPEDTYAVASAVHDLLVKTHPADLEKIALIKGLVAEHLDIDAILAVATDVPAA